MKGNKKTMFIWFVSFLLFVDFWIFNPRKTFNASKVRALKKTKKKKINPVTFPVIIDKNVEKKHLNVRFLNISATTSHKLLQKCWQLSALTNEQWFVWTECWWWTINYHRIYNGLMVHSNVKREEIFWRTAITRLRSASIKIKIFQQQITNNNSRMKYITRKC